MTDPSPQDKFLAALQASLAEGRFVKLTLSSYKGAESQLKNIYVRPVQIKREARLSFTYRYQTRDIVKNPGLAEGIEQVRAALDSGFKVATLFSTDFDLVLDRKTLKKQPASQTAPAPVSHDRDKKRLIPAQGQAYLHALAITDAQGAVYKNAQDKYRQINKYVEILSGLVQGLAPERLQRIVDMGSGKGYLTFALCDYLRGLGQQPDIVGVEYRADLVDLCNRIARDAGFTNLHFAQGAIGDFECAGANILIALHACNTATDDALYKGITAGADLIVVAPCCHKQIRQEMEKSKARNDLDFLMKHGIFVERQAEMVTDGLRALVLEAYGYSTKVFEFISDAHTPKNVMIVGTRTGKGPVPNRAVLDRLRAAKAYFGIGHFHLETLLGL
jgi:protein-L-isoaspartate O-methyltransferase